MKRSCVRGAEVLQEDGARRLEVWIEGGRIAALAEPDAPPHFRGEVEIIDGRGMLAIPGLVNGHTHSQSALLQGAVPGEPLDLFVIRAMARRAPRSERAVYIGALFHAMSMLKRGITAHIDHLRDGLLPTVEHVDAALRAYRDIGSRATVAPMYEDRMYLDSLPIDQQALPEEVRSAGAPRAGRRRKSTSRSWNTWSHAGGARKAASTSCSASTGRSAAPRSFSSSPANSPRVTASACTPTCSRRRRST